MGMSVDVDRVDGGIITLRQRHLRVGRRVWTRGGRPGAAAASAAFASFAAGTLQLQTPSIRAYHKSNHEETNISI